LRDNFQGSKFDSAKVDFSPPANQQQPDGEQVLEQIQYSIVDVVGEFIENELTARQHRFAWDLSARLVNRRLCKSAGNFPGCFTNAFIEYPGSDSRAYPRKVKF
jgi:hypothetical protein